MPLAGTVRRTVSNVDAFLATMVTQPPLSCARAAALARDDYGLEVRAERLTGERDENFRLTAADGAQYVLKIANAAEDPAVSELLTAALRHVARADPALPCPRVVTARDGAAQVAIADETGARRTVRLLTYLPGILLGAAPRSAQQRRACGRMAARLSCALREFRHPAAQRALIWDLGQVGRVQRLLEELPELPHQQAAAGVLLQVVPVIEAQLPRLRRQVVHNDLNPLNILVAAGDATQVTGVIDFGDLTHTALVADVAVAAAELIPPQCAPGEGGAAQAVYEVAAAYHESLPLLPEEWALLGTLVAARLVANVVVPAWHVQRNPAGGHYCAPDPEVIQARLALAAQLLTEEMRP